MDQYRSYFLDAAARVVGETSFPAPNMAAALDAAQRLLSDRDHRVAAELWRDEHYVGSVLSGAAGC
jgi:hypothetical protein